MFKLPSSNILSLSQNVFLVLRHTQGMSNNSLLLSTFVQHQTRISMPAVAQMPEREVLTWVSAGYSHIHLFRVRDSELEKILERDDLDESVCHVFCSGHLRG